MTASAQTGQAVSTPLPTPGKAAKAKKRIYFLDMMKALAVLMMVEGHTVDAFLGDASRSSGSLTYTVWLGIRGFTAPIFMFSSGVVFTYLLKSNQLPFFENPRVRKGFLRFLTLVAIGYLLRWPGKHVFDFSSVSDNQWRVFFTVDALHLIGFGLLFTLVLALLGETLKAKDWIVFLCGTIFFFGMYPFTESIHWKDHLPTFAAAYLYHGTGSYFPFFPWTGYVLSGAVLGSCLARHPDAFASPAFSKKLLGAGVGILASSILLDYSERAFYEGNVLWIDQYGAVARRLGAVLMLNGVMSFIAQKLKSIPQIVKQVGKHTLVVYVVHLVLIYGCAWYPGMNRYFHRKLTGPEAATAAAVMVALMLLLVALISLVGKIKKRIIP
ncbi:MAG: DUF1624 domain-containing protein [Acidobacteriota bacterium]|nr:DUF1624 domain-containing protein [Acidobacteriota bacterium]